MDYDSGCPMVQAFADEYIQENEGKFIYKQNLEIYVVTWNVASCLNPDELSLMLLKSMQNQPNIIVIGLQEVEMSMSAIMAGENVDRRVLEKKVYSSIPKNSDYYALHSQHLGGISLLLFAKISFKPQILSVTAGIVPLGPFSAANKGAVCVSLNMRKTFMCFVCSHLPAHHKNIAARNEAYEIIVNKMVIKHKTCADSMGILDHDIIYWLGDLNYRIDFPEFPNTLAKYSIKEIIYLTDLDQLLMARKNFEAFNNFEEAPIRFKPTYKLTKSEGFIDYNKQRLPAWCDRILYRSKTPEDIETIEYNSVEIPVSSDHYPVIGKYKNNVYLYDLEAYEDILTQAYAYAEEKSEILQPKISLPVQHLVLGKVEMFKNAYQTLTIHNVGRVDVELELRYQHDIDADSKWVFFDAGPMTITPGKSSMLVFRAYIDEKTNTKLSFINSLIEFTLILTVKGGRIYFITLEAQYQRGAFGYPLELLVKSNTPLKLSENEPVNNNISLSIPIQLLSLTNYINSHIVFAKETLFQRCELDSDVRRIMDMLDTSKDFRICDVSVESACNALLFFLKCMPKKLVAINTIHDPDNFLEKPFDSMIEPFEFVLRHLLMFFKGLYNMKSKYLPNVGELCKIVEPLIFSDETNLLFVSKSPKKKMAGSRLQQLFSNI